MNSLTKVLLLVMGLCFWDCQRTHLKHISANPTIKRKYRNKVLTEKVDFKYLQSKCKIEYTDGLDQFTSLASIRLKRDSVIWVSINPALGVEVVRCLLTTDSVFVLNKLQKEYYKFSYSDLSRKLHFDLNYQLVQEILLGNTPFDQSDEDSIRNFADTSYSILLQRRKNVAVENIIRHKNSKLERLTMKEDSTGNSLEITYENFLPLEGILFPHVNKISMVYFNKKGIQNTYIGIEHKQVETSDHSLKFPFSISPKYERKY